MAESIRAPGMMLPETAPAKLARRIGLPLLTLYGLGTILGAGIYVLVGEVTSTSGLLAPLAFLVAALIAGVTAMSYAQLSALYPRSAGEAVYVLKGLGSKGLSTATGWLIVLTGIVSSATMANGFVGYARVFLPLPHWLGITSVVVLFGGIAMWGIAEAMWAAAVMTILEIVGLVIVIGFAGDVLFNLPHGMESYIVPTSGLELNAVFAGAFLAFYAFIGFEDIVNVAEEVKDPGTNLPRAIFYSIGISTIMYILISMIVVASTEPGAIGVSEAPLAAILDDSGKAVSGTVAAISVFAIVNGLLIQVVMGSRVLYGLAMQGSAPARLSSVNPVTRTPILATFVVVLLVLAFALWLPLVTLAKITSFIILTIFILVNLALWRLKREGLREDESARVKSYPLTGATLCLLLILSQLKGLIL